MRRCDDHGERERTRERKGLGRGRPRKQPIVTFDSSVGARVTSTELSPEPDPTKTPVVNDTTITPEVGTTSKRTGAMRKLQMSTPPRGG